MRNPTTFGVGFGVGVGVGVGDDLPEDFLIQNILVRLPVASLLRFKSVSKSWCSLIQSSFFIDLHTTTTLNSSSSSSSKQQQLQLGGGSFFILQASRLAGSNFLVFSCESAAGYGGSSEYRYRFGSGGWFLGTDGNWFRATADKKNKKSEYADADHEEEEEEEVVFKLDNLQGPDISYNSSNHIRPTDMVGSCNGLICLFDSKTRDVFLWNPATRLSRILPKSSLTIEKSRGDYDYDSYYFGTNRHSDDKVVFCAFGFDVKAKDYKVLLINYCTPKTSMQQQQQHHVYSCGVQVYSLSTDSWRLLEGITSLPGLPMLGHHGIYLNGSCFFLGTKTTSELPSSNNSLIVISFDFTNEIFTTMQFPSVHDDVVQKRSWYLSCLGDHKLALFAIQGYKDAIQDYNDDYGNYGYEDKEDYEDRKDYKDYEDCDIWVLNEHGGGGFGGVFKESWAKLNSFQIQRRGAKEWIIPRGILNNGEFALLETRSISTDAGKKKMQLYNLVTKEAKTDFLVCQRVKTVEVYKPSLVSIIGGNGAAEAAAGVIGGAI